MHHLIWLTVAFFTVRWLFRHPGVLLHVVVFGGMGILLWVSQVAKEREDKVIAARAFMGPARIIQRDKTGYIEITKDGECITHSYEYGRELIVECYKPETFAKYPGIEEKDVPKYKVLESPQIVKKKDNVRKVY